jgi:Na+-transporting methylmalonyl-CoA/oxaloacetate decarboxylase gamma subunit
MIKDTLRWVLVVVTCPCHVPLLAGLLAGTAAGAWLTRNMLTAMAVATVLFVLSLLWLMRGAVVAGARSSSDPTPEKQEQTQERERAGAAEEVQCPSCAPGRSRARYEIASVKGSKHGQHEQAGRPADEAGARYAG